MLNVCTCYYNKNGNHIINGSEHLFSSQLNIEFVNALFKKTSHQSSIQTSIENANSLFHPILPQFNVFAEISLVINIYIFVVIKISY